MTRRLVVWRHGQTAHNAEGIYQGQLDTELSPTGVRQAVHAAGELTAYRPVRIVSSDLARALATARVLARSIGLAVHTDSRLREIDVGAWSGLTGAAVRTAYPGLQEAIEQGADPVRGGHGETMAQVAVRTAECAVDVVAAMGPEDTVVLVTHGASGRALVAGVLGMDQAMVRRVLAVLPNAHWAELVEHPAGWRLAGWGLGAVTAGPRAATR